jgi:hypothetical protein
LATLLTVLEMRWQRRTTYKPDLLVEPTGFEIYPSDDAHFRHAWRREEAPSGAPFMAPVRMRLRNGGCGVAKI